MDSRSGIPEQDRIPLGQKVAFAAGVNMDYVSTGLLTGVLWMPFFNIGLGLSPALLGIVLMVFRGWDAFADLLMGNISDNTRSRWGRRRPYLFAGAILVAAIYPLFWFMPAAWSDTSKAVYLAAVGLAFFTAFTIWSMPYYGMQLELTPNYDERSRLTAWMALAGKVFYLGAGWFLPIVMVVGSVAVGRAETTDDTGRKLADFFKPAQSWLAHFPGVDASDKPIVAGMRITCWSIVASTLLFGLLPALFVRERYSQAVAARQPREPLWQSIRESLACGPLWHLIGVSFLLAFGQQAVANLGQYVNFYYVNHGNLTQAAVIGGWRNTVSVVVGIVTLPLFIKLGEVFDKRPSTMLVLGMAMFGHAIGYFCIRPDMPYLQIVSGIFESCALNAFWMFLPSMKADVADYDELHTSRRREGAINAFYSWFVKVAGTLALGVGGGVLQWTGFDATLPAQSPDVLQRMFVFYLILPVLIWAVAIALLWRYPLSRARAADIRTTLENRREAAPEMDSTVPSTPV